MDESRTIGRVLKLFDRSDLKMDWVVEPRSGFDLQGQLPDGRILTVEVKRPSTVRHPDLVGRLAHLTLLRREVADEELISVAAVSMPKLPPKALATARTFMSRFAPDIRLILVADAAA